LEALLTVFDDCVASHESAALLHGLPILDLPPYVVATRRRGAWRGGESRVRIAPLPAEHIEVVDGLAVTTVARTIVDIARTSSLAAALVTGDAAILRCGRTAIERALGASAVWAETGRAARSVAQLNGRSESPLESVSRAMFIEHQLPLPELQTGIDASPSRHFRVDFYWRLQRVVGEADGLVKYDGPGALRAEKLRQEQLEEMGLRVVRWTWRDMLVDTDRTIARIRSALDR
jgi:very-short-patch-repair endonuclease